MRQRGESLCAKINMAAECMNDLISLILQTIAAVLAGKPLVYNGFDYMMSTIHCFYENPSLAKRCRLSHGTARA